MKTKKRMLSVLLVAVLMLIFFMFPMTAAAADKVEDATLPSSPSNNIQPPSDISENPNYAEGFTSGTQLDSAIALLSTCTVNGGCSITKNSSTSVTISGYSTCSPSDTSITASLSIQAYYNGAWHTLATKVKSASGSYVSLTQAYNVTSGYYYRVRGRHYLSDGTSKTSSTSSIWVG